MSDARTSWIRFLAAAVLLLGAVGGTDTALAHEGHDSGTPTVSSADPNIVVRSAADEHFELLLKYRASAERPTHAIFYLSDFATNAPIAGAAIQVRATTPADFTASAAPSNDGIYAIDLPHPRASDYTLVVTVTTPTSTSEFALQGVPLGKALAQAQLPPRGTPARRSALLPLVLGVGLVAAVAWLLVRRSRARRRIGVAVLLVIGGVLSSVRVGHAHAGHDNGPAAMAGSGPRHVSKESQFLLGVRTVVVRSETLREPLNSIGHVVPQSGALATVAAPQTGRFERVGRPLSIGDRVRRGQLLGYLLVIDRLPVRAPISGMISQISVTSGQWVQAGQALAQVLDVAQVGVEVPLFGDNLTKALGARSATVRLPALPDRYFPATVRGLAPTASALEQPLSGNEQPTAAPVPPVLLRVSNTGGMLRPGMLVEVTIETAVSKEVLAVPEQAIVYQESTPGVFVHTAPESFEFRAVAITGRYPGRVGVEGPLKTGDRVVTSGAPMLVSVPTAAGAAQ